MRAVCPTHGIVSVLAEKTRSAQLGLARTGAARTAHRPHASPPGDDGRGQAGGSDLLQDALDEVGRHNPELSNG